LATFGVTVPDIGFHDGTLIYQDGNDVGLDQQTASLSAMFFSSLSDTYFAIHVNKDWLGPDEPLRGMVMLTVN
jgi:hypothetical protein